MQTDRLISDLNRMFARPLPEFYTRRIVVWYDEEGEFQECLPQIRLENARLAVLTGSNSFSIKKLLAVDDPDSNYLLYCPLSYASPDDDWLLDVKLYSESFQADLTSTWMDEMNLPLTEQLRSTVRHYRLFFASRERRMNIAALPEPPRDAGQLHLAVLSQLCGADRASLEEILRCVLSAGLDLDSNRIYGKFLFYQAAPAFWQATEQATGYTSDSPDLGTLACHILLTAASRTLPQNDLSWTADLQGLICLPCQSFCYDFLSDWIHSDAASSLADIAMWVERTLDLPSHLEALDPEALADTELFPCINRLILHHLMVDISNHLIDPQRITALAEKRRTCAFYRPVRPFYEALIQTAALQDFYRQHAEGYQGETPQAIWEEYLTVFHGADLIYRRFHLACAQTRELNEPALLRDLNPVAAVVEDLYSRWFLREAGSAWTRAAAPALKEYGTVPDLPGQGEFFRRFVAESRTRTFVIVSRSLRYEEAVSLRDQLQQEIRGTIRLDACLAVLPTADPFGLAALLPHRELALDGDLNISADGVSTADPEAVLTAARPDSAFVTWDGLMAMKGKERTALIRGRKLIWILHIPQRIREASGRPDLFADCSTTIRELTDLVKTITTRMGGHKILITSDHGFLATRDPLPEEGPPEEREAIQRGPRHVLAREARASLLPARPLGGVSSPWTVFTPPETFCLAGQPHGNLVSGGASLQEMTVPVLSFRYVRTGSREYEENPSAFESHPVSVLLLSTTRKITSQVFTLEFYQLEPVVGNRTAATYLIYFADRKGHPVSDTHRLIADRTSEDIQGRTFSLRFSLKNQTFRETETYGLLIQPENSPLQPRRTEFQISITPTLEQFSLFD